MKNKKVLILSVVAIILVVVIVFGVLYFATDLFKTEQQLFYKYIAKIELMDSNFINQYNVANDKITKNSNSSSAVLDVSTSAPNQATGVADVQKVLSVTSNGLENTLLKQSYRDFTFSSNDQNFLTLKYLRDDNTYGIIVDNILAKYLAVENANLKDLFSKLGVTDTTNIPDSIPTNYEEILKIDEATLEQLKQTYGTLIYNNISKDSFYKITNDDRTETIGLSLSEQEVINILKSIFEIAKNDTTLLNLIITKAQMLKYNNITIESIQTELQTLIDQSANNTYSIEKDFIKISLTKKDKNVIGIEFEVNSQENTLENTEIIEQESSTGITPLDITVPVEQQSANHKYKVKIDLSEENKIIITTTEDDVETQTVTIGYIYDTNNISFNTSIEFKENQDAILSLPSIKMQYQISNYQTDNIAENLSVNINTGSEENLQINLVNNTTLKQDIQISKLTTENSAKLNDMTAEELSQLFTALGNRINELYGESFLGAANNIYSATDEVSQEAIDAGEQITDASQDATQNAINAIQNINNN